jgi:hypothetical protein
MARRRRRSSFRRSSGVLDGRRGLIAAGAAAILIVGGFVYLQFRADAIEPARAEVRVPLPDAFAEAAKAAP